MIQTPVCIIGAGPGGAATALKLSYLNIACTLIDKATFPRDKICGDAISGKVTTLLNRLDPEILKRFNAKPVQVDVWGITCVATDNQHLRIPFKSNYIRNAAKAPGYVSKRIDFDSFLIEEVKRRDNITFLEGTAIESYQRIENGYRVSSSNEDTVVETPMLIIANGAHSAFSRTIVGLAKDNKHHAGALRAYYNNVAGMDPEGFIELHFIKSITPGYFWIFPLPNGQANVGLGLRTDYIKKRKVNLRKTFQELLTTHPILKERFKDAELIGDIKGYGLPLGSKFRSISGDHYMLVGDAGHLIDPLTGEGIGNAFYSGFIAAEQAQKCLEAKNYSAPFLKAYDIRVKRVLGSEMKLSYRLQKLLAYPWIVNLLAKLIARNRNILDLLSGMYTDFSLRKKLVQPLFWLKTLAKR